jgi:hypothetical protein
VTDVNGIIFALNSLEEAMRPRLTDASDRLVGFFTNNKAKIKMKRKEKTYEMELPGELSSELMEIVKNKSTVDTGHTSLKNAIMLAVVSHWDSYMSSVLEAVFEMYPTIIDSSGRSLTFSELQQYTTIEDARKHMIDAEIEGVIRGSHASHFSYLEKKVGVSLKPREAAWHCFLEMTERRNLFAHTGGIISRSYVNNCCSYGISLPKGRKVGDRLEIDRAYLMAACDCVTELGVELGHVIWRKSLPDEREAAEGHYHRVAFDLIVDGRYKAAIHLLEFALKPPMRYSTNSGRLVDTINLAQAYKWSGEELTSQKVIDREDWSAVSLKFGLAVAVLKDDFPRAARIVQEIGANGEMHREAYDTWPLFQRFRESDEFKDAYRKVFGQVTEIKELSALEIEGGVSMAAAPVAERKRKSRRRVTDVVH